MMSYEIRVSLPDEEVYLIVSRATQAEAVSFASVRFPEAIEIECEGIYNLGEKNV